MANSHKTPVTEEAKAILSGKIKTNTNGRPTAPPSQLLEETEQYIRRYVILPQTAYLPLALWSIATHAVHSFDCFPYIAVVSAVKRSGKTRLTEVLENLTRQPWRGTTPSQAVLYRMLGSAPTLLLDETELFNGRNKSETTLSILAVLNAGHRKGATVPRCDGPQGRPLFFPVYGPKLFAAIGQLPDTLMDRSIIIHMQRRSKNQKVKRFLQARAKAEAQPLQTNLMRFTRIHRGDIDQTYQQILEKDLEFLNDRDADLWIPLFTMCSILNPERLPDLQTCAVVLSGLKADDDMDDSYSLSLLRDIRSVWPDAGNLFTEGAKAEQCETTALIVKLKALEDSPWSEHQLTAHKLARMLRPFGIFPRQIRIDDKQSRGYVYAHIQEALDRYLGESDCHSVAT